MHMGLVEIVFDPLEIIAWHWMAVDDERAFGLIEFRKTRQLRRRAFAQVGEDEPKILLGGIGPGADLLGKGRFFRRLFAALAVAVEEPAVIEATDAVAFDRAE